MRVNVSGPVESHSTSFRPRNAGVNALTDDLVFELSYTQRMFI
jgi:hypothetical protein